MKGTVVFDFDYTLLDTARVKAAIRAGLLAEGVDEQVFLETWEQAVMRPDGTRDYDPARHAELVAERTACGQESTIRIIEAAASRTSEFLYDGAETVLRRLHSDGWRLVLMTRGVVDWQKRKFAASGLHSLFERTFFLLGSKRELIEDIKSLTPPVVMVNDDGSEIDTLQPLLPDVRMIAVRGPRPLPSDPAIAAFKDLEEVYTVIQNG